MKKPEIILVNHLFAELYSELILLLRSLDSKQWYYTTSSAKWNVKDIVAHLVDGDLRRISFQRDKLIPPTPSGKIENSSDLVDYLNQLNSIWVEASRRLSPQVLIELLEYTGKEIAKLFSALDLNEEAIFSVGWAGEDKSENWFDIAREYTEKWYHQQQIREAVGARLLNDEKWLRPLIDTFVRGLPNIYQTVFPYKIDATVYLEVSDIPNCNWILKKNERWELFVGSITEYTSKVVTNADTAWRMFSKNISTEEARKRITVEGETELGLLILDLTTFMK
ncbi:MAG: maleylpyruvate isomerase N-terminal domain-containing protein [Melioribacteraceae bacterium]